MAFFRIIKQALFKQGIRPMLLILQLMIGFTALTIGLGILEGTEQFVTKVKNVIPLDAISLSAPQVSASITNEQLQEFYSSLQNDPEIKQLGTFLTENMQIPELQNDSFLKNRTTVGHDQQIQAGTVNVSFVDSSYFRMFGYKVMSGRTFTQKDFSQPSSTEVPVLIGSRLGASQTIGSTLTGEVLDSKTMNLVPKKFVVVGILPPHFTFWDGGDCLECSLQEDDARILAPVQPEQEMGDALKTRVTENLRLVLKDSVDPTAFRNRIEQKMNIIGVEVQTKTVQEEINYFKKEHQTQIIFSLSFAGLLLFLSSFGLLGVILTSIVRRQREFGIRYAIGATPGSLARMVVGEVFILIIFSGLLGVLATLWIAHSQSATMPIYLGPSTCLMTLGVILVIGLIGALTPMMKVVRMEPISLIRGEI